MKKETSPYILTMLNSFRSFVPSVVKLSPVVPKKKRKKMWNICRQINKQTYIRETDGHTTDNRSEKIILTFCLGKLILTDCLKRWLKLKRVYVFWLWHLCCRVCFIHTKPLLIKNIISYFWKSASLTYFFSIHTLLPLLIWHIASFSYSSFIYIQYM